MTNPEARHRKPRCQFITKSGSRCHADPQTGKGWCFMHDPEQKKKQAEACPGEPWARKQGGEARARQMGPTITLPPNLPVMTLESFSDVLDLLGETVNHIRQGQMDVTAARAIGYLAGLLQRSMKANAQPMVLTLADTINRFRRGEMDLPTAKTIGHLTALMLNALKQQAQQQKMAGMMAAGRTNEPTHRPETNCAEAQRHGTIGTVITSIAAAKPPDHHELHPAITNIADVSTTSQSLSS